MPKCDDCGTKRCSCVIVDGDNTTVLGTGSKTDPYVVNVDIGGAGGTRLVGEIIGFGGGVAPTGWLICDGSAVSRATYASLFAVVGTTYGIGDGTTTFNLPDLAGRFPLGADGDHARGTIGGLEQITIGLTNLPSHTHTIAHTHAMDHVHGMSHSHDMSHGHGNTGGAGQHKHTVAQSNDDGSNNNTFRRGAQKDRDVDTSTEAAHVHGTAGFAGSTGGDSIGGSTGGDSRGGVTGGSSAANSGATGSGQAHTNMPPYSAITFIIKT